MTATIEHHVHTETVDDALPVALMPEASEQLAWHEEQLRTVPTDQKSIAQHDIAVLVEQLMGDKPGLTLINEIVYLSGVYDGRAVEQRLNDGSTLRTWGTRHSSNQYLSHRYYAQQRVDGSMNYRVMTLNEMGRTLFEIDDQGEVDVTVLAAARFAHDLSPYRPHKMGEEAAESAMRELFRASMVSAAEVRKRAKVGGNQAADYSALQLLANGPVESQLFSAQSEEDIDAIFAQLNAEKPVPYELLRLPEFKPAH